MRFVVQFVVALVWGILNLFLAYEAVLSIAYMWELPYITRENLPFVHFWGYVWITSIILASMMANIVNNHARTKDENGYRLISIMLTNTLLILFFWAVSWGYHLIKDWAIFQ